MTIAPERTVRTARPQRLPRALVSGLQAHEVGLGIAFVVLVTLGLWVRHGGLSGLVAGDLALGLAQLTGLGASLAALGGVLLVARPRWMERRYGLDRMLGWHRWVGTSTVVLLLAHVVFSLLAYGHAEGRNIASELWSLMASERWMVAATVGTILFVVIGLTSWRRIRTAMAYETWYFVHLTAYLAVLLGFAHQLTLGSDFASDPVARWWWIALYLAVLAVVLWDRGGDLARAFLRRPLRVQRISWEGPDVCSVHIAGPGLASMRASAGQYFLLRFGTGDLLWQAHPVSLSAAPTDQGLRFTLKNLGDGSAAIHRVPVGTRAFLEGPYGRMTADRSAGEKVLMVAGGVGIAPLRAVLEDCTPEQEPVFVVRVRHEDDVVHRAEVDALLKARNGRLYVIAGPRHWFGGGDPFKPELLRQAVPDVGQRHLYLCGPESLERAVERSARACGVPTARIHVERFGV